MNTLDRTVHHEIATVQGRENAKMYFDSARMFNAKITALKGRTRDDQSLLFVESSQFECSDGTMLDKVYALKKVCKNDRRVINVAGDFTSIYEINSFLKSIDGQAVVAGAEYKTVKQVLNGGHWVSWSTEYYKHICCNDNNERIEVCYNIHSMNCLTQVNRKVPLSYFEDSAEVKLSPLTKIRG